MKWQKFLFLRNYIPFHTRAYSIYKRIWRGGETQRTREDMKKVINIHSKYIIMSLTRPQLADMIAIVDFLIAKGQA